MFETLFIHFGVIWFFCLLGILTCSILCYDSDLYIYNVLIGYILAIPVFVFWFLARITFGGSMVIKVIKIILFVGLLIFIGYEIFLFIKELVQRKKKIHK